MRIKETCIEDCFIVEGKRFFDERGFVQEIYSKRNGDHFVSKINWKQVNWSSSKANVVRGIHVAPYRKFITCVSGGIYDVVIDLRSDSDTLYKSIVINLNEKNATHIFIPSGCGHGFFSYTNSTVIYLQEDVYEQGKEKDWHWRSLPINWPRAKEYILSDRDKKAPPWKKGKQ